MIKTDTFDEDILLNCDPEMDHESYLKMSSSVRIATQMYKKGENIYVRTNLLSKEELEIIGFGDVWDILERARNGEINVSYTTIDIEKVGNLPDGGSIILQTLYYDELFNDYEFKESFSKRSISIVSRSKLVNFLSQLLYRGVEFLPKGTWNSIPV